MPEWVSTSPQTLTFQWRTLSNEIEINRTKEQLTATVLLRGGSNPGYFDNIYLGQGMYAQAPIGQLSHCWITPDNYKTNFIVFAPPIKVNLLGAFFTFQKKVTIPENTEGSILLKGTESGRIICRRTLNSEVSTQPGTLEPFSEIPTDLAIIGNLGLSVEINYPDTTDPSDLVIVLVWEVITDV